MNISKKHSFIIITIIQGKRLDLLGRIFQVKVITDKKYETNFKV